MIQTFEVANVRCGGCAQTIRTALADQNFTDVKVDLMVEPRKISAEIENDERLVLFKKVLRSHGYPLISDELGFIEDKTLKAKSFVSCATGKFSLSKDEA